MAVFDIAYNIVIGHEGGYQNIPEDKGNKNSLGQLVGTNFGITALKYESFLGYPPSQLDMQNMPISAAKYIYKRDFWDKIKGDQINSQQVANIFFDGVVNHGRGVKIMQSVLGVNQDGIVGPATLSAINSANPQALYDAYKNARINYYHYLVSVDPSQSVFLNGWLKRINSFNYVATAGGSLVVILLLILITRQ